MGVAWLVALPIHTAVDRVGRVADEPGVGVVAGRPGLAGRRAAQLGGGAGAAGDDTLQHVGHVVGHVGRQDRWWSRAAG